MGGYKTELPFILLRMHSNSAGVRYVVLTGAAASYNALYTPGPLLEALLLFFLALSFPLSNIKLVLHGKSMGCFFADGNVAKHTRARSWVGIN